MEMLTDAHDKLDLIAERAMKHVSVFAAIDGRIAAMDLAFLKNDKSFFPNYALVPIAHRERSRREARPEGDPRGPGIQAG